MASEKSEKLYKALHEVDPGRAPEIVHKYNAIMDGINKALIHDDKDTARQARDHLDVIADDLIYQEQRADLIEPFEQELDTVADSLGISVSVPTDVAVDPVTPTGFAERQRESELRDIFDSFSAKEWSQIMNTLFKEGVESLEIPEDVQYRVEQLNAIIMALEAMQKRISGSKGIGEDFTQLFEFEGTTSSRANRIGGLIRPLKNIGIREIVQNGLTIEQLLLKHNTYFGDEVKDLLRSHDKTQAFFDQYGRLIDVTNETGKRQYYLALIKHLRDQHDYQTAQTVLEDIMSEEFQLAVDLIPGDTESTDVSESNVKGRLYDKAEAKVGKLVTDKVLTQWRKEGYNRSQVAAAKRNLVDMHYERLLHQHAAEHILCANTDDVEEGQKYAMIEGKNKVFWEHYNDMLDPKNETFNLTDESWDMILEELVITAPLIVVSGGVAGAVVKGLSYGARAALAATRVAAWGAGLARGGRLAKGVYRLGRLSAAGTGLLTEGFLFELTFQGLQGELLFNQEEWVKKILWTSAALGLFKGAGKLGGKGAEAVAKALKGIAPKLADKKLIQLINRLLIIGHTQVAAMLVLGAAQHIAAGEFEEFWDNFGYQVFHAYVAVGSLNVSHGVIRTAGGVVFRPPGKKPGSESKGRESVSEKEPVGRGRESTKGDTNHRTMMGRLAEAMRTGGSESVEVRKGKDLTDAIETLAAEGFKLEAAENGGIIARKGGVEIFLNPTGRLKGAIDGISGKLAELNTILEQNGGKVDGKTLRELTRSMERTITDLTKIGIPKRLATALSLLMLTGCESVQKLGGGAAGLIEAIPAVLSTLGIGYGGGVIIYAILKGRAGWKSGKAEAKAWEALQAAEGAAPGAGAGPLATRLSGLSRKLQDLKKKVKGSEYAEVRIQLGLFDAAVGKLIAELRRAAGRGPRQGQIDAHLKSAREALTNLTQPESPLWSTPNLIKMATGLAAIIAALFVMNGAGYFGDSSDEPDEIPDIPTGPASGGNGGGGIIVDDGDSNIAARQDDATSQQGDTPPQQGGTPPQQGGTPPQQGGTPPQQGGTPPQQGGTGNIEFYE